MNLFNKNSKKTDNAHCHGPDSVDIEGLNKIMVVGNPNVGKSVVFNRLTGAYVVVSNYPGTTVTIDTGKCSMNGKEFGVIDSPGMYSLLPITEEERIAKQMLIEDETKVIVNVIDSKNLERMLPLSLELIETGLPVIVVINMMDEAERLGIKIDFEALKDRLGVSVVPMTATKGKGLKELKNAIADYRKTDKLRIKYPDHIETALSSISGMLKCDYSISRRALGLLLLKRDDDTEKMVRKKEGRDFENVVRAIKETEVKFSHPLSYVIQMSLQTQASRIIRSTVTKTGSFDLDFKEKLSRAMITPITGIPILIIVLYFGLYLFVGVFGAGFLVNLIEGTLFGEKLNPAAIDFIYSNIENQPVRDLLVGDYGVITLGITYSIAIIFPIVGTFFLVFSVIEDTGYLPRLSLLIDRVFKKIGLSGRAVIPMVLGLGCVTMATIVTRTQETKRERVISTLLLALAIPCSAQLGVIFAILSGHPKALLVWFVSIILNLIVIGYIASKLLPGDKPNFYMELPPLRLPKITNVLTKTYTRMVWYFKEIFPLFLLVSVIIWFLNLVGVFQYIISGLEPVVHLLGLPNDAAQVFLFGFFRRDYGAAGLFDIQDQLTGLQMTVAAVTLTLFVPCVAQLMIMIKERGVKTALAMFIFVFFYALFYGFLLYNILSAAGVQL